MEIFCFVEGDVVTILGSILGVYDKSNILKALQDMKEYFDCVHFEHDGKFITDQEIELLVTTSSHNLFIKTNEGNSIYIFKGQLNKPLFS